MRGQKPQKKTPLIFICKILLIIFWLGFAVGTYNLFRGIGGEVYKVFITKSEGFKASLLDVYIELLFKQLILVWVLVHLQWIMLTISRGKSFDRRNLCRIQKVALGAFAFALLHLVSDFYWSGLPTLELNSLYLLIKGEAFRMALFGVVILIIGKAFEIGVKIQRDQDLTI